MSKRTITNFIIAIIFLCVAGGVFGFMVYRVTNQGVLLQEQIIALQTQQAQESSHLRLQRLADETAAQRASLSQYFLARDSDSIDFLNVVETLAPRLGVALTTSGLNEFVDGETQTKWINISFTFLGGEQEVKSFLKVLETLPYVLRVISAEVEAKSPTQWQVDVTMQVQVLSYET